jgi:DNA-directed RNA polymerase specialized sigma24 family protein
MEIVKANIAKSKTDRAELFQRIYEPGFYRVASFVAKNGGTYDDAQDIFQDALVVLCQHLGSNKEIESELAYVIGISKNLWYSRIGERSRTILMEDFNHSYQEDLPGINENRLLELLTSTGRKCMDLLVNFYYENAGIKNIMKQFGFISEHSASVQKHKCIEKLRETIKTKSLTYEDFFE